MSSVVKELGVSAEGPYMVNVRLEASQTIGALNSRVLEESGLETLQKFAASASEVADARDREMSEFLKDDAEALKIHRWHMRKVRAHILLLRDGYVPAIQVDPHDHDLRRSALVYMAVVHAQFDSMRRRLSY